MESPYASCESEFNRILRWVARVIVPVGVLLLLISQLSATSSLAEALVGASPASYRWSPKVWC